MQDFLLTPAELPAFLIRYLVGENLPTEFDVYTLDDHDRSLLRKLLVYDSANPTNLPVPSDEQITGFMAIPKQNGLPVAFSKCRLFAQDLIPTITDSATILQVWVDRAGKMDFGLLSNLRIKVRVLCHYAVENYRSPTGIYSRSMAIANLTTAMLDFLDLPEFGIGKVRFAEMIRISDNRERNGYELTFEVTV